MLLEAPNTEFSAFRIPGLIATEQGTLLGYYECRRDPSDWASTDLKIIRSMDRGDTWETVTQLPGNGHTLHNPVMIVEGSTIHLLYGRDYQTLYHAESVDDGHSFTDAVPILNAQEPTDRPFYVVAIGPGHGIAHKGRLLVPAWFARNEEDPKEHHPSWVRTLFSEDHGRTWQLGEILGEDLLQNPSECAMAVTAEDQVFLSIRNENPCRIRACAVSETGIGQWEDLRFHENLPDPICMGSMQSAGNKLLHINCASQTDRRELTVKISSDGFASFDAIRVDGPAGYSDLAVLGQAVCVLYERDTFGTGELHFRRFSLENLV